MALFVKDDSQIHPSSRLQSAPVHRDDECSIAVGIVAMNAVSPEMLQAVVPAGWNNIFFGWTLDLDWTGIIDAWNRMGTLRVNLARVQRRPGHSSARLRAQQNTRC